VHFFKLSTDAIEFAGGALFKLLLQLLDMISQFSVFIGKLLVEGGQLVELRVVRVIMLTN
jgi:hypothetical protein